MIRVSVMYPRQKGKTFNLVYYKREHMALVHEKMDAHGLQCAEVDGGIQGLDGHESPFFAIGHLIFNSFEEYELALLQWERIWWKTSPITLMWNL